MARLETQINQIFIVPKDSGKVSLILFEEKLSASQHLFLLAEIRNIQKKTEANDLAKIADIIIEAFKTTKKIPAASMFEAVLPDINNRLADFAHKGRKSWLGKFSALVALKADRDFHVANTGHTAAWLKRKNELNEIASPDKSGTHPLKTFVNFASGRLAEKDSLVLATSSIFNYISLELFSKTLNSNSLEEACPRVADILKSSARSDEGFAVFMLDMVKKEAAEPASAPAPTPTPAAVPLSRTAPTKTPAPVPARTPRPAKHADGVMAAPKPLTVPAVEPAAQPEPVIPVSPTAPIYAPMPEDLEEERQSRPAISLPRLPSLAKPSLPSLKVPSFGSFRVSAIMPALARLNPLPALRRLAQKVNLPKIGFISRMSGPAKFFLGSFLLFVVLFGLNIAAYSVRKSQAAEDERFNASAEALVNILTDAESALLYRNHAEAMRLMSDAQTELHRLEQLDPERVAPFQAKMEEMDNKVNRVTVIRNLMPVHEAPYPVTNIAKAGAGFLVSNDNPNSLGFFEGNQLNNIFMLNSTDGELRGIAHVSGAGNFVATKDKLYLANSTAQEFQQAAYVSNGDLQGLKFTNPNRMYSINKATDQVIRFTVSGTSVSAPTDLLQTGADLQGARDLAVDNDIFVLFADRVEKYSGSGAKIDFTLGQLSEPVHDMTKIRVGNQVYILEPIANRILIYSRTGELMNQIRFPELDDMKDIFIDEGTRELMVVNGNSIYRITF